MPIRKGKTLGEAMAQRRRERFAGRVKQLAQLTAAFAGAASAPHLVTIVGPAGVGKSTLARRFGDDVRKAGGGWYWISGDDTPPNARDIVQNLAAQGPESFAALGHGATPDVLVLDAFERLTPLARWFFEVQLPRAGSRLCIVVTTRQRLDARLRSDLAIQLDATEIALPNLSPEEATTTLLKARVPEALHASIYASSQGHSLVLSLFADRYAGSTASTIDPADASDAVGALVRELLREAPTPAHRDALYALSIGSALDVELLRAVTGDENAEATMEWLSERSFTMPAPRGLAPHPLVREALFSDLVLSHPRKHATLADRTLDELERRLPIAPLDRKLQTILEMIHVRRDLPLVRDALGFETMSRCHVRRGTDADAAVLAGWIASFEGEASAKLFHHWYGCQPAGLFVLGDEEPEPAGVYFMLRVGETTAEQRALDPIVQDAWELLADLRARTGTNDELGSGRWFFARGTNQTFGLPNFTAVMFTGPVIVGIQAWKYRWLCFHVVDPARWAVYVEMFGLERLDRTVHFDGHTYGANLRDLSAFIAVSGPDRERALVRELLESAGIVRLADPIPPPWIGAVSTADEAPPADEHGLLDEKAFLQGVRAALPLIHRRHQLKESPLIESAMVGARRPVDRAAAADRLSALITDACGALEQSPSTQAAARLLAATFVRPAVKQQAAAAALKLPYGTYRYQLRGAVELLAKELWEAEWRARSRR